MVTTGLAFILMAAVYLVVDAKRIWNGAPFLYAGRLPITKKFKLISNFIIHHVQIALCTIVFLFCDRIEFNRTLPWSSKCMADAPIQL